MVTGNVRTDSPVRHVLQAGERLTVTADSVSSGRVGRVPNNDGAPPTSFQAVAASQTLRVGPFPYPTVHTIESLAGILSYTTESTPNTFAMHLGAVTPFTGSRTLHAEDNGKLLRCDDGSNVTVTIPADLPEGFNVGLAKWGAGNVTIAAGSGATNRSSTSALSTQYNVGSLLVMKAAEFVLGGDFA